MHTNNNETLQPREIAIPSHLPWPVQHYDPDTGQMQITEGTIERIEYANDLPPGTITDDIFSYVLMAWYKKRLSDGIPADPLMEALRLGTEQRTLH